MRLFCPLCGGKLRVGPVVAGMKGPCTHCGEPLEAVVPDEDAAKAHLVPSVAEGDKADQAGRTLVEDSAKVDIKEPDASADSEETTSDSPDSDGSEEVANHEPEAKVTATRELESVRNSSAFRRSESYVEEAEESEHHATLCPHCGNGIHVHLSSESPDAEKPVRQKTSAVKKTKRIRERATSKGTGSPDLAPRPRDVSPKREFIPNRSADSSDFAPSTGIAEGSGPGANALGVAPASSSLILPDRSGTPATNAPLGDETGPVTAGVVREGESAHHLWIYFALSAVSLILAAILIWFVITQRS